MKRGGRKYKLKLDQYGRRWLAFINIALGVICVGGTTRAWVLWTHHDRPIDQAIGATILTVVYGIAFIWGYRVRVLLVQHDDDEPDHGQDDCDELQQSR
jgi:hypothetical protein